MLSVRANKNYYFEFCDNTLTLYNSIVILNGSALALSYMAVTKV